MSGPSIRAMSWLQALAISSIRSSMCCSALWCSRSGCSAASSSRCCSRASAWPFWRREKSRRCGSVSRWPCFTLYGLVLANLVLAPLACIVNRRAAAEETERQKVLDWLADQVAGIVPPQRAGHAARPATGREAA